MKWNVKKKSKRKNPMDFLINDATGVKANRIILSFRSGMKIIFFKRFEFVKETHPILFYIQFSLYFYLKKKTIDNWNHVPLSKCIKRVMCLSNDYHRHNTNNRVHCKIKLYSYIGARFILSLHTEFILKLPFIFIEMQ